MPWYTNPVWSPPRSAQGGPTQPRHPHPSFAGGQARAAVCAWRANKPTQGLRAKACLAQAGQGRAGQRCALGKGAQGLPRQAIP